MRVLPTLVLTTLFASGIVTMMMFLGGVFEPKVKVRPSQHAVETTSVKPGRVEAVVKLVRRPRQESAVGTIRAVYEAVVASKILARVEEVEVKAGQDVKQGDVLVVLDKADLQIQDRTGDVGGVGGKGEVSTRRRSTWAEPSDSEPAESITQSELDQANTAFGSPRPSSSGQRAVEESPDLPGLCHGPRPDLRQGHRQEGQRRRHRQPGPDAADHVRSRSHADGRHGPRVAGLAVEGRPGDPARLDTFGYECHATISEIVPEAQAESRSFQVKVTGPCPPNVYSGMFGRIFIPLEDEEVLVVPPKASGGSGSSTRSTSSRREHVSRRAVQLGRTLDEGREVLSGLRKGEKVVLCRRKPHQDSGGTVMSHQAVGPPTPSRSSRLPQRDRPRFPRQQLLDHPDRRLAADRPGGLAGHGPRGGPADRRAAGRRHGQHAGLLGRPGRAARRHARWRRSSIRSTASNTSTAWPARTRPSSRSGSTSARTASGASSSCSRRSTRTRTSCRRA